MIRRLPGARLWLVAFVGLWLLFAGWAFAAPYDGPPDEQQHALRAAAIMNGDVLAGADRGQLVPDSLYRRPFCFPMRLTVPANCAVEPGGSETDQEYWVAAARYNPVYYAITGWPLGFEPNWRGIVASRLLNGAAMAALIACAVVAAVRWTRHKAMLAGVVVAVTPMVAHLGGAINPNGVEIAAGLALFAALLSLVHDQREGINRAAVALAGVSASVLVTPRFAGVLWLAVIVGAVLIPSAKARLRELARSRVVRIWSGVVVLAVLASVGWTLLANTAEVGGTDKGQTVARILRGEIFDMWPIVTQQMVGVMGWAETPLPGMVYAVWYMAAGLLLLGALVLGNRVDRWRLSALFLATFAPLAAAEVLLANTTGYFNQGRYFLPGAVGLPLLAAYVMSRRGLTPENLRSMTRLLAFLLVPIQLICLPWTMARWSSGWISLNPYNGSWFPHYGVTLPLVLATLGTAVLFFLYWRASRVPASSPPPPPPVEAKETVEDAAPAQTVSV
ncbi:MAG TPA: DUF2142 domain-containing protein [Actinophytocola sp.]|uniref:DUF2142 domain-containing protein n=1 Tax=Actinophytocola sp. TaxID=1872138 RepID=UPI002DFB811C|nr:DUF2142 domain-containing protein [Actinophytocola sp.]